MKFYLEMHHSAEDEVLFPAAAEKVEMPASIAVDHDALDHAKMVAIESACKNKDLAALKAAVLDLGSFCRRHMKDEEELLLPKINESFDLPWFGGVMGKFGPWYRVKGVDPSTSEWMPCPAAVQRFTQRM